LLKTRFIDQIPLQETLGKHRKRLNSPSQGKGRYFKSSYSEESINSGWLELLNTLRTQKYAEIILHRTETGSLLS